jgi:hypothetical protein
MKVILDMDHTKLKSDRACITVCGSACNSRHMGNVDDACGAGWWGEFWTDKEKFIVRAAVLFGVVRGVDGS